LSSLQTPETGKEKNKNREFFSSSMQLQIRFQKSTEKSQILHVINLFFNVDSKLVWPLRIQRSFVP
jgi:hypothetical protein